MLDREVAIKAIRPDLAREPQIVERFRSEARLLARVQHPAIATIYSFFQAGEGGEELFLAMEFVKGRTLAEVLAQEGPMNAERAVRLLGTALDGIEQAHVAGIIHRDLKPENLMLTEGERLKVMDFGIARMAGSSHLTRTGLLVGTLRYMAPEQIRGEEVDRRTDVYALGIVLYQLLTGRVPFDGTTDYSILRAQLEDAPPPPRSLAPAVPAEIERAVLRALAKDPAERFDSIADFHRALRLPGAVSEPTATRENPFASMTSTLPLSRPVATGSGSAPRPDPASPSRSLQPSADATMATDRTRAQASAAPSRSAPPTRPPLPPPPPPGPPLPATASTSYRPIEKRAWKRTAALAAGVVVLAVGGFALWRSQHPAELPPAPAAGLETSAAGPPGPANGPDAGTALAGTANGTGMPGSQPVDSRNSPGAAGAQPVPTRTAPQPGGVSIRPSANPGAPPGGDASLRPAPPQAGVEPAPAVPSAVPAPTTSAPAPQTAQEAEPAPEEALPPSGLPPLQELRRLAAGLVDSTESLTDVYATFLDQKDDAGEELTASDTALRDEIEALGEAAGRFNANLNGKLARARARFLRPNVMEARAESQRRAQELEAKVARVDQLMAAVHPSAEVRQAWSNTRAQWKRARQLALP